MENETAWCQLDGRNLPVRYWLQGQPIQNFGDFLTEFFLERLFLPYGMKARAFHIIGSCMDDIFFDPPLKEGSIDTQEEYVARRVVFWGCGIRKPDSLGDENRQRSEILSVRGPLTRSALRLGDSIPLGDPAFFLPALYKPAALPPGKSVCVPHFKDQRSDAELIELSGCASIIRPNMPNSKDRLLRFIDGIVASDFVLASSFHGALVAAAYGRPFAFWDNGVIDLPFKWADFSELVSIPCKFAKSLKEAMELYGSEISPNYTPPRLWPLLASAPFAIKPDALIKVLRYDLQIHNAKDLESELNQKLDDLNRLQTGRGIFRDYFGQTPASKLRSLRLELSARQADIAKLAELLVGRDREVHRLTETVAERDREVGRLGTEASNLSQTVDERNHEVSRLGAELRNLTDQTRIERENFKQELAVRTLDLHRLEIQLKRAFEEAQAVQSSKIWRGFVPLKTLQHRLVFLLGLYRYVSRDYLKRNGIHPIKLSRHVWRLAKAALLISRSGLFDRNWYLEHNKDIVHSKIDPLIHYMCNGADEGRDPNPIFDSNWYINRYPDVTQTGVNPLAHYISDGAYEGRDPNPLFDSDWYLRNYPDVAQAGSNPLAHYINCGAYEGRDPNPIFDSDWYLQLYSDVAQAGVNPLAHYINNGALERRHPNPLFDSSWYLQHNQDVAQAGINPLAHYIHFGAREGRDPNPYFDTDWYLQQNPDIAEALTNPLAHYIQHGADEGRNPSKDFDAAWYLAQNRDVAACRMNPLKHFLTVGIKEGRLPKAPIGMHSGEDNWPSGNSQGLHANPTTEDIPIPIEMNGDANPPKILLIDSIYPRPDRDSGSIDTTNYIQIFREFGYQVIFASDSEFNLDHKIHQPLEDMGVRCVRQADYISINRFIEHEGRGFAASFLSRVHCGGRYYELIRTMNPGSKIIFNTVDLHGLREEREARLKNDFRALNLALRTNERERYLARQCDATIVVSKQEQEWLETEAPGARILHIPLMRDCPGRQSGFEEREGICYVGSYLHTPNIDAVVYFLESIWPSILQKIPSCKFYIVGSGLPDQIAARNDPNVQIIGHVPDLRNLFEKMRLSVAPLRFGAGAKGKVVSSLAHGLPCVATEMATEGMNLVDDLHLAIENSPSGFADRVVQIYNNENTWTKLSDAGYQFCSNEFSLAAGRQRVSALFEKLKLPIVPK
jgi:glycosyltransferase involved in cell wall biosynthesis